MRSLVVALVVALMTGAGAVPPPIEADAAEIRAEYEGGAAVDMLAKILYREARGVVSDDEKAAVVWCVLNRVDDGRWPDTIAGVVTQRHQFAWNPKTPVTDDLRALALDVVVRWQLEKRGYADVGRVLPAEYVFFSGARGRNWFRTKYRGGKTWAWGLPSPYKGGVLFEVEGNSHQSPDEAGEYPGGGTGH